MEFYSQLVYLLSKSRYRLSVLFRKKIGFSAIIHHFIKESDCYEQNEFLEQLSSSLRNMPNLEKEDIISEYETHFISGKQDGISEEEISKS